MRRYLFFILLFSHYSSAFLQTATVSGHVSFSRDSFNLAEIRLIEKGIMKNGCMADSNGNFSLKEVPYGDYELEVRCGNLIPGGLSDSFGSYSVSLLPVAKIKNLKVDSVSPALIEIRYPGICEYDNESSLKGICPEGHTDKIIPIVYGYPSRKGINKANNGQIILGGCIVSHCDPHWYCKIHDIKF